MEFSTLYAFLGRASLITIGSGVYLVKDERLVLSEYAGDSATEHVTISIARESVVQLRNQERP